MQAYLFVSAIELVLQFGENPEQFFQDLKPLIIRHIKYGVKSEVRACALSSFMGTCWLCLYQRDRPGKHH